MSKRRKCKTVRCADGLHMSVQASEYNYSSPRNNTGPYTHVEVGHPSRPVPELIPFAESSDYTNTIYGYVPYELVRQVIYVCGGMVEGELPPPAEKAAKIKL